MNTFKLRNVIYHLGIILATINMVFMLFGAIIYVAAEMWDVAAITCMMAICSVKFIGVMFNYIFESK